jgi:hypothetical protein
LAGHINEPTDVILGLGQKTITFKSFTPLASCKVDFWPTIRVGMDPVFGFSSVFLAVCAGRHEEGLRDTCYYMDMFDPYSNWIEAEGKLSFPKYRANGATLRGKVKTRYFFSFDNFVTA